MNIKTNNNMQTTKELTTSSFDAIHGIIVDHLIENFGHCDHDEHGQIMVDIIHELQQKITN